jgi:hypothetical protein
MFLKNFKLLFAFAGKHCRYYQQRMTCNNIFSHEGLDFGKWLEGLLAVPKRLLAVPKRLLAVPKRLLAVPKRLLAVPKRLLAVSKRLLTRQNKRQISFP